VQRAEDLGEPLQVAVIRRRRLLRKTGCGGTETAEQAEDQDAADHFVPG